MERARGFRNGRVAQLVDNDTLTRGDLDSRAASTPPLTPLRHFCGARRRRLKAPHFLGRRTPPHILCAAGFRGTSAPTHPMRRRLPPARRAFRIAVSIRAHLGRHDGDAAFERCWKSVIAIMRLRARQAEPRAPPGTSGGSVPVRCSDGHARAPSATDKVAASRRALASGSAATERQRGSPRTRNAASERQRGSYGCAATERQRGSIRSAATERQRGSTAASSPSVANQERLRPSDSEGALEHTARRRRPRR